MATRKKKAFYFGHDGPPPVSKWAAAKAPDWSKVDPAKVVIKDTGAPEPQGQRDMFGGYEKSVWGRVPDKVEYEKTENKSLGEARERGHAEAEKAIAKDKDDEHNKVQAKTEEAYAHADKMDAASRKGDKAMALYHARQSFKAHVEGHNLAVDRYGKDSLVAKDHAAEAERRSKDIGKLGGDSPNFDASKHPRDEKGRFT